MRCLRILLTRSILTALGVLLIGLPSQAMLIIEAAAGDPNDLSLNITEEKVYNVRYDGVLTSATFDLLITNAGVNAGIVNSMGIDFTDGSGNEFDTDSNIRGGGMDQIRYVGFAGGDPVDSPVFGSFTLVGLVNGKGQFPIVFGDFSNFTDENEMNIPVDPDEQLALIVVPEPASVVLLGLALAVLGAGRSRLGSSRVA